MSAQDTLPPAGAPHSGRQLLDAIIDPSLTGSQYVEQIAKLNIHIPATRSWKNGKKWPHQSIPREIFQYSPDVTGPMCIRVGLFGELEMQRFWNDLNAIVEMIWASWDNMHAARHTRQWDVKEMREALLGQLWSLWKEPAGFPNALVIMKWFRGFVAYRVKKSRRSRKRQRNTSPKPVKISKPAVPRVSIRAPDALPRLHIPMIQAPKGLSNAHAPTRFHSPQALDPSGPASALLAKTTSPARDLSGAQHQSQAALDLESGLENLFPLATMNLVVSWSSDWNGTQSPPLNEPAYALNLSNLGITTLGNDYLLDPDRASEVIVRALQFAPVSWDSQHQYIILLDSQGGLHYAINSATAKNKGRILEALRSERRRNQRCLKIKIVKRFPDFNPMREDEMMVDAGGSHVPQPANMTPLYAAEVRYDPTTSEPRSIRHEEAGRIQNTVPLGFMNIIVSRASGWDGDGYPPADEPSYAITLSSLGVLGFGSLPKVSEAIVHWLKSDAVRWDTQQELIVLLGSDKEERSCIDESGTNHILGALLKERERNKVCLKMKIVPRVCDLGSASEDELMEIGDD